MLVIALSILAALFALYVILSTKKISDLRRSVAAEQKTVRQQAVLNDTASMLATCLDMDSLSNTLLEGVRYLAKSEMSALLTLKDDEITWFYTSMGPSQGCKVKAAGILERALKERSPISGADITEMEGFKGFPARHPAIKSILVAPVLLGDKLIGQLIAANKTVPGGFTHEDEDFLLTLGFQAALAIEKVTLHQTVLSLASRDGLTGLYNHRVFKERLEMECDRAKRLNGMFSLLMLDIDHFKNYNDTYGHIHGDGALKTIALIIADNIRNIDFAARYGGEEFSILLLECQADEAVKAAEKLKDRIGEHPFMVNGEKTHITASIGIAVFPEDADDKDSLIDAADKALYYAKRTGRHRVASFRGGAA